MSAIIAFGSHTKGGLRYWPHDSRSGSVANLNVCDSVLLDVNGRLQFFDGRLAHGTQNYKGKRTSVIWFAAKGTEGMQQAMRDQAEQLGFRLPDAPSACVGPSTAEGYDSMRQKARCCAR